MGNVRAGVVQGDLSVGFGCFSQLKCGRIVIGSAEIVSCQRYQIETVVYKCENFERLVYKNFVFFNKDNFKAGYI